MTTDYETKMNKIYKYKLKVTDYQEIVIPLDGVLLDIQCQNGELCLWALVETEKHPIELIGIYIVGTGNPLPEAVNNGEAHYFNTVQQGNFVWHTFIRDRL